MKLLFSLTYYLPHLSGLTEYVRRLAELMSQKNNQVAVLCIKHKEDLEEQEMINQVRVVRANPLIKISKGFLSIDWFKKSRVETANADVIIVNLPQVEGMVPAIMAKIRRKKLVVIYHSELSIRNKFVQTGVEMTNRLILGLANEVVAYTEDFAKNSKILRPYLKKIVYLYPIVPIPRTEKKYELNLRKKIGQGRIVGIAARLAEEKGFEYLFEAIKIIKKRSQEFADLKIAIAGPIDLPGEEKYQQKIFSLAKEMKNEVVFLGKVSQEKMGSFYKIIEVLTVPSVNSTETFGIVQVEAMRSGVPVAASDLPGVRVPVTKTGFGKIVKPADANSLAEAIMEILRNKTELKLNKIKADEEFDEEKISEKLIAYFGK